MSHIKYDWLAYLLGIVYLVIFGFIVKESPYYAVAISAFGLFLAMWALYDKTIGKLKLINWGGTDSSSMYFMIR